MKLDLKISHKGLILVAVPLVFQLIFVAILFYLLEEANHEAAKERHAHAVVAELNDLLRFIEDTGVSIVQFTQKDSNPKLESLVEGQIARTPEQFRSLKNLLKDDPDQLAKVKELERLTTDEVIVTLNEINNALRMGNRMRSIFYARPLIKAGKKARIIIEDLRKPYRVIEDEARGGSEHFRVVLQVLLRVGVGLSIALALALAFFFSRSITTRLDVLTDNSRRLSGNEALNPQIGGGDEIARLDRVFHETADKLAEAARMKQEFVAMVSHDLRSPITSVQGTLSLLAEGTYGELNDTGQARVDAAEKSIDRLVDLINDLLDLEKLEAGMLRMKMEKMKLESVVTDSVDSIQGFADEKGVKLETELSPVEIEGDHGRLVQVVVNLLTNALKFSPPDSTVILSLSRRDGFAEVRVKDMGPGIPEAYLDSIFDRFKQVECEEYRKKKGTGLGLAISKAIIEGHKGTVGVDSKEGEGATFWFRLPA